MKRDKVQVGKVYAVKVSGKIQPVRLQQDRGPSFGFRPKVHAGWVGVNELTGREVRILTAGKLRYEVVQVEGKWRPAVHVRLENERKAFQAREAESVALPDPAQAVYPTFQGDL